MKMILVSKLLLCCFFPFFFFFPGFDTDGLPSAVWPGGETEALTRLERHLERKVRSYR